MQLELSVEHHALRVHASVELLLCLDFDNTSAQQPVKGVHPSGFTRQRPASRNVASQPERKLPTNADGVDRSGES
jgi:hypothetical protein